MTEQELIQACKLGNRRAQRNMYERYAAKMFGVCRRYIKNEADVEEVLLTGFYKVFSKLEQFQERGNFEAWIRRIMVNESLMFLRKNKKDRYLYVEVDTQSHLTDHQTADQKVAADDILSLLDHLPPGYRSIFNLYAIEGYKHREIAEMLGISINTSKSQLIKARKMLQKLLLTNSEYKLA